MSRMERVLRAADTWQQRHRWLALGVAAWKKFGDDQAGNLAALIAFYAFASIFPLLLVLVTVLDLVLRHNPAARESVLNSALANYPVIGNQLRQNVHALGQTGAALVIGLIFTFAGALGIAAAMQNALNSAWEVPFSRRPGFPWSLVRSIGLIVLVGIGQIVTGTLSGIAAGSGHVISGAGLHVAAVAVSLLFNIGVFWAGFRLATASDVATRDLRLGAFIAAPAWQVLQLSGGYLVAHQLARSSSLYGTFGLVLGLLAWLFLEAQITLYAVEMNVTAVRRLWPRSLFPPPLTEQDLAAYRLYAEAAQRRPDLKADVEEASQAIQAADTRKPGDTTKPGNSTPARDGQEPQRER